MTDELTGAVWRKSVRSGQSGDCVEVATNLAGMVPMRDTKDRDGGTLTFSSASWAAFVEGVKRGEFDLPA
jgi:hypothetical protein